MDDLPVELTDYIISYLMRDTDSDNDNDTEAEYQSRIKTLSSLSKVSKRFRRLAEPYLYSCFDRLASGPTSRRLLRTICGRPSLAEHIKSLNILLDPKKPPCVPTPRVRSMFVATAKGLKSEESLLRTMLVAGLEADDYTVELMLILCLATRVETFLVNMHHDDWENVSSATCSFCSSMEVFLQLAFASGRLKLLPQDAAYNRLRAIRIRGQDTGCWINPHAHGFCHIALSAIMQLPALSVLECSGLNLSPPGMEWPCGDGTSSLRSLTLELSCVNSRVISEIVRSCKRLHYLDIDLKVLKIVERGGEFVKLADVNLGILMEAIRIHKTSLRRLSISDKWDSGLAWSDQAGALIGSLQDFPALTHLEVDDGLLAIEWTDDSAFQVDLDGNLPPNLDRLTIHSDGGDFEPFNGVEFTLQALLSVDFPATLEWLEITSRSYESSEDEDAIAEAGLGGDEWSFKLKEYSDGNLGMRFVLSVFKKHPSLLKITTKDAEDIVNEVRESIEELLKDSPSRNHTYGYREVY